MPAPKHTRGRNSRRLLSRRLNRALEIVGYTAVICYGILIFTVWLSTLSVLQISNIRVSGTQSVDPGLVTRTTQQLLGEKIFWKVGRNNNTLYPRAAIERALLALDTHIRRVDIQVVNRELLIVINEYAPAYIWCPSKGVDVATLFTSGCYFSDESGHLFSRAPSYSGNPFLVFTAATSADLTLDTAIDSSIYTKEEFYRVKTFLGKLAELRLFPRMVTRTDLHDFLITTDRPWTIRWSSTNDPAESVQNLQLVLQNIEKNEQGEDMLATVDLRFGNKVFYR